MLLDTEAQRIRAGAPFHSALAALRSASRS